MTDDTRIYVLRLTAGEILAACAMVALTALTCPAATNDPTFTALCKKIGRAAKELTKEEMDAHEAKIAAIFRGL